MMEKAKRGKGACTLSVNNPCCGNVALEEDYFSSSGVLLLSLHDTEIQGVGHTVGTDSARLRLRVQNIRRRQSTVVDLLTLDTVNLLLRSYFHCSTVFFEFLEKEHHRMNK